MSVNVTNNTLTHTNTTSININTSKSNTNIVPITDINTQLLNSMNSNTNTNFNTFANNLNIQYTVNPLNDIIGNVQILYLNIRSIRNKIEQLENLLSTHSHTHIIVLTETWLQEDETEYFNLSEYEHFHNTRASHAGGVSIYVHNCLSANAIYSKEWDSNNMLGINIRNFGKSFNIFAIYKQPRSNFDIFNNEIEVVLEKFKNSIIFGDFNLNILDINTNENVSKYVDNLYSNGFIILNKITSEYITRRNNSSGTIIDHVLTDILDNNYALALHDTDISDHRYFYTTITYNKNEKIQSKNQTYQLKIIEYDAINATSLTQITTSNDTESFVENIKNIINENTKTITKIKRICKVKKPWINDYTLRLLNIQKIYFKLKTKFPNNSYYKTKFIYYRNKVNYTLRSEKKKLLFTKIQ